MGDRANIKVIQQRGETSPIWIYTHGHGYELPTLLQNALKKAKPRWDDESYATRILFDQVSKSGRDQETGWGLSTYITDNQYNILEVDFEAQSVRCITEDETELTKCTLAEFCELADPVKWRGDE